MMGIGRICTPIEKGLNDKDILIKKTPVPRSYYEGKKGRNIRWPEKKSLIMKIEVKTPREEKVGHRREIKVT